MTQMKLIVTIGEDGSSSEKYVPLSNEEIAQREVDALAYAEAEAARQAEAEAKATARAELEARLIELGITQEELATLQ